MTKTEQEIREIIKTKKGEIGRQKLSELLDCTPQYVSMLLRDTDPREITPNIAAALGYKMHIAKQKVFEPIL